LKNLNHIQTKSTNLTIKLFKKYPDLQKRENI